MQTDILFLQIKNWLRSEFLTVVHGDTIYLPTYLIIDSIDSSILLLNHIGKFPTGGLHV